MKVAILGMGAMGTRVAERLLQAGHSVTVWSRNQASADGLIKRGAQWSSNPREASQNQDFVLSVVTDDEASRKVWLDPNNGALAGLGEKTIGVEMSTVSPSWSKSLGSEFKKAGRDFLEVPMIGSRPHVEKGVLCLLIGGSAEHKDRAEELFESFSGKRFWVGPVGRAASLKLMVNGLFAIQVAAFAEILESAKQSEWSPAEALEILKNLPVTSPAAALAANQIVEESFAPLFPVRLVEKDLRYLLDLRSKNEIVGATARLFAKAQEEGFGELNISGVAKAV